MGDSIIAASARRAWTAVLGEVPLDDDENFFEAGGDSITAVELIMELSYEFETTIPVAELFRAPTLGGLVAAVERATADEVPTAHHTTGRTLVRLRRGGAGRLWCFLPPLSGAVTRYAAMPRLLPPGDAIWAMETPAELSAGGLAHLVDGLASRLVREDLGWFQTIVLSGYSLGGVFAHELAQAVAARLTGPDRPEVVAALLDPPDPAEFRPSLTEAFDIFVRVGWRIDKPSDSFVAADGTFELDRVADAARAAGTLPVSAPDRELADAWTVYASNAHILDGYVVTPGVAATYLLQCDDTADVPESEWGSGVTAKGAWADAIEPAQVSVLAVDHFAMLEAPNDSVVGRWLAATADRRARA
jgi:acyl carrier protein/thioesterase domain-containing protein